MALSLTTPMHDLTDPGKLLTEIEAAVDDVLTACGPRDQIADQLRERGARLDTDLGRAQTRNPDPDHFADMVQGRINEQRTMTVTASATHGPLVLRLGDRNPRRVLGRCCARTSVPRGDRRDHRIGQGHRGIRAHRDAPTPGSQRSAPPARCAADLLLLSQQVEVS